MIQLQAPQKKWLVSFHLLFVIVWLGTAICMFVLFLFKGYGGNGQEVVPVYSITRFLYHILLLPAAIGSIMTGFFLSLFTHWGFTKHVWIIVKWVVSFNMILFITIFLDGWVNQTVEILMIEGAEAVKNVHFIENAKWLQFGIGLQIPHLIVLVFISTIKPWGKRKKHIEYTEGL